MIYLPSPTARPAPLATWLRTRLAHARRRAQRRQDRKAFKTLLHKDDATLRDIGVTRFDVEQAAALPLSQNAALELRKKALARR